MAPICGLGSTAVEKVELWAQGVPVAVYPDFGWMVYVQTVMKRPLSFWVGVGAGNGWVLDEYVGDLLAEWEHNDSLETRRLLYTAGRIMRIQEPLLIPAWYQQRFIPMEGTNYELVIHFHTSDYLLTRKEGSSKHVLYLLAAELETSRVFLTDEANKSMARINPKKIPHMGYKIQKFSLFPGLTQRIIPQMGMEKRPSRAFFWFVLQDNVRDDDSQNPFYVSNRGVSKLKVSIGSSTYGWEGMKWKRGNMLASRPYQDTVFKSLVKAHIPLQSWGVP